ncbi:hypothetical protein PHLGIDRAFT_66354, partial [Phlebiopsis gigantea 11061_1 CR5-6]
KALTLYEYVVTIDQEVNTVWKRRNNATSMLLLTVRWAMVMNAIIMAVPPIQNAPKV